MGGEMDADREVRPGARRRCRICQAALDDTASICARCAGAAADYVLEQPPEAVRRFWDVDTSFEVRRNHHLRLAPERAREPDACRTYAGLATGCLAVGRLSDAALTAALSIRTGTVEHCCWDPVAILFDDRLLRVELSPELSAELRPSRA
jgi:hypothetical protein